MVPLPGPLGAKINKKNINFALAIVNVGAERNIEWIYECVVWVSFLFQLQEWFEFSSFCLYHCVHSWDTDCHLVI